MTAVTHTHAENAQFLTDLAGKLAHAGILPDEDLARLYGLAAREAEQDPDYVAYVNAKVRAALARGGRTYTEAEIDEQIKSW